MLFISVILFLRLRTKSHTALEGECFTVEVLEVGVGELNANSADLKLGIAEVTCGGHLYVSLECLGVCVLEVFKLCCPRKRADDVCVDAVLCPFRSRYSGESADAFFSRCVRALTVVAKKTCAGSKVDDRALCFFKVGIASLHIIEGCVKA